MSLNQKHGLGRERKFFLIDESDCGTFEKPAGVNAAKVLDSIMSFEPTRNNRDDSRQTRSTQERITGKSAVSWSAGGYVIPSGVAGTRPDIHEFLKNLMGTYVNTPATSDAYTLNFTQTIQTMTLTHHASDVVMESVFGAWINQMTITASGGSEHKFAAEGGAMGHVHTGTSTLNGAMAASATMIVQTADGRNFEKGGVVKIDADDNSGAGFEIDVDTARPSFTIEAVATGDDASDVIPFTPTETTAGSPIAGILGSVVIDSVTFPITAFEVTINNNIKPLDDEVGKELPTDALFGFREVTGSLSIRARKDFIIELGKRKDFLTRDIAVVLGSTAGSILTIDIDQAEFDFSALEIPQSDEAVISLPFTALGSSGEDEISLTFT